MQRRQKKNELVDDGRETKGEVETKEEFGKELKRKLGDAVEEGWGNDKAPEAILKGGLAKKPN